MHANCFAVFVIRAAAKPKLPFGVGADARFVSRDCFGRWLAEKIENNARVIFEVGCTLFPKGGRTVGRKTNALFVIGCQTDQQLGLVGAANDFPIRSK